MLLLLLRRQAQLFGEARPVSSPDSLRGKCFFLPGGKKTPAHRNQPLDSMEQSVVEHRGAEASYRPVSSSCEEFPCLVVPRRDQSRTIGPFDEPDPRANTHVALPSKRFEPHDSISLRQRLRMTSEAGGSRNPDWYPSRDVR